MTEERNEHKLIQEVKRLMDSAGLVTARMVESVTRTAQMASTTVPEIQDLFSQWLSLIGGEVARMAASSPEMDIASTANRIGIEESSLLSLLLMLQREGALSIESVRIGKGKGKNSEICSCLMGTEEDA